MLVSGDAETVLNDPTAQELYFGKRFDAGSIIEGKESFSPTRPADDAKTATTTKNPDTPIATACGDRRTDLA